MSRGYNAPMMGQGQPMAAGGIPMSMSMGSPYQANSQMNPAQAQLQSQQIGSRGGMPPVHQNMQNRGSLGSSHQKVPNSAGSLPMSRKSLSSSFSGSMRGSTAGSEWNETALNDDDNVRVVVRCRPMNENERNRNDRQVLYVEESGTAVTLRAPGGGGRETVKNYRFNMCFLPKTSQEQFFDTCGIRNLLDSALNGYAATVFAYGQTGSGKTFTISGIEERISDETSGSQWDGLIPRAVRYAFENIAKVSGNGTTYSVRASFAEIYNEQVYDLLNLQSGPLQVRWNIRNGFFVQDLFVVECENTSDVMAVVKEGHRNRRVGSHELNMDSSRSHSLLTLHLESESIDPDDGHTMVKFGKMVFVDLAGSERLKQTQSDGVTLKETGAINQSLFALGKVISALGTKKNEKKDTKFVPYRDSKLTKLLMDSLGGSCLTLMVACCSPSEAYMEETLSTLNYATRARNIQNRPMIQMDQKEQLIFNLRQEVKLLRLENDFLRQQLSIHNGGVVPSSPYTSGRSSVGTPLNGTVTPRSPGSAPPGLPMSPSSSNGAYSRAPPHHVPPLGPQGGSSGAPPGLAVPPPGVAPTTNGRGVRGPSPRAPKTGGGKNNVSDENMQKMLSTYRREIERLKTENREVRARGSVAERGYRAVMAENERLCNKLEHLEEIFVHQSRQTPWPEKGDPNKKGDDAWGSKEGKMDDGTKEKLIRKVKAENSSLRMRVQRLEKSLKNSGESGKFRTADSNARDDRESERDVIALQQMNVELQKRLEKYRKREMELLRALKAQQAKAQKRRLQESGVSGSIRRKD
jgi:kinesin family member 12